MHRFALVILVVSALAGGCVLRNGSGGDDDDDDGRPGMGDGGSIPDDLVGDWYAGAGGVSAPYDPVTGSWGRPNGEGLIYMFEPDGSFTRAYQSYHSNGGCTNGFTAFESGWVDVDGDTLVTTPTSGHLKVEDTCVPSLNSDDPLDELHPETLFWELRPSEYDPNATVLYLQNAEGASSTFSPL